MRNLVSWGEFLESLSKNIISLFECSIDNKDKEIWFNWIDATPPQQDLPFYGRIQRLQ